MHLRNGSAIRSRPAERPPRSRNVRAPVVVIGAGPYGLATAAHLDAAGVPSRIFGEPMRGWRSNMPEGMFLKSLPVASSISAPEPGHGLMDFRASRGQDPVGDRYAIPIEEFVDYGRWFQRRRVPEVEPSTVLGVQADEGGFGLTLDSGEEFHAADVVVATGLLPYAHQPPVVRAAVEAGLASHTSEHRSFERFRGRRVAVLGGGQSALESAALLREAGAEPTVVVHRPQLVFGDEPQADSMRERPRAGRLRSPGCPLGPGWSLTACCHGPAAVRYLPAAARGYLLKNVLGPSGAWWLRERVEGRVPVLTGRTLREAVPDGDTLRLTLSAEEGESEQLVVDHLLIGTGYRVDVDRLRLLEPTLRQAVHTVDGAPRLSPGLESSVRGLYFTGLSAAPTFGPVLRFVHGTGFAARRTAAAVAAGERRLR